MEHVFAAKDIFKLILRLVGGGQRIYVPVIAKKWLLAYQKGTAVARVTTTRAALTSPSRLRLAVECGLAEHIQASADSFYVALVRHADTQTLQAACELGLGLDFKTVQFAVMRAAAQWSSASKLQFLLQYWPTVTQDDSDESRRDKSVIFRNAAKSGSLENLVLLYEHWPSYFPLSIIAAAAAKSNSVAVLEWVSVHGAQLERSAVLSAIARNAVRSLQWLHTQDTGIGELVLCT